MQCSTALAPLCAFKISSVNFATAISACNFRLQLCVLSILSKDVYMIKVYMIKRWCLIDGNIEDYSSLRTTSVFSTVQIVRFLSGC